jgi:hypothetical protein
MNALPPTGTAALLEKLSPYLNDVWINELLPRPRGAGRRRAFSAAQLLRLSLLALLTPAHHLNLLLRLLPENRAWRRFAHLPNQRQLPDAKMMHQFRERLSLIHLRQINNYLVRPLLQQSDPQRVTLAIMDATALPAATNAFKKRTIPIRLSSPPWERAQPRPG